MRSQKNIRKKIHVAVICGGPSNEHEISLRSGAQVAANLPREKYDVTTIKITKSRSWRIGKKGIVVLDTRGVEVKSDLKKFDVIFIALHGTFGEDGRIQALLDVIGIPYTSSGVLASALGMNKLKTMGIVAQADVQVPRYYSLTSIPKTRDAEWSVKRTFGYPCVVKPNESGSSMGVTIVQKKETLLPAIKRAFRENPVVIIQKYVKGREITCGVMGNSGQTKLIALPPVEIIPPDGHFFDYKAKYSSPETKEICPANLPKMVTKEVQETAKKVHFALGCDGLTRSDFILSTKGQLYFLEINTIPGLTEASLCPKEAKAAGMSFGEFLDKQIELALTKHRVRNE